MKATPNKIANFLLVLVFILRIFVYVLLFISVGFTLHSIVRDDSFIGYYWSILPISEGNTTIYYFSFLYLAWFLFHKRAYFVVLFTAYSIFPLSIWITHQLNVVNYATIIFWLVLLILILLQRTLENSLSHLFKSKKDILSSDIIIEDIDKEGLQLAFEATAVYIRSRGVLHLPIQQVEKELIEMLDIKWKDVKEVDVDEELAKVDIHFIEEKDAIKLNLINERIPFLLKVPSELLKVEGKKDEFSKIIASLEYCEVCGTKAVIDDVCDYCSEYTWEAYKLDDHDKIFSTKKEYLKAKQRELFEYEILKAEESLWPIRKTLGYKLDKNWKQFITWEEVKDSLEEEYRAYEDDDE